MDMRHIESVHVNRAVVHVLDKRLEEPFLAQTELQLTEDLHEFFMKHLLRTLRSAEGEKARFVGEGATKLLIRKLFDKPDTFLDCTQEMARRLFAIMRPLESISGGDLALVQFQAGEGRYLGILKLDYRKSYQHEIEHRNEQFDVTLKTLDIALPLTTQQLTACAVIKEDATDDSYDLLMVEKPTGEDCPRYFMNRFLGADRVLDKRDHTRLFRKVVETFVRQVLRNDADKAREVRSQLNEELLGSAYIDIDAFAGDLFAGDPETRGKFEKRLMANGLPTEEKIEVDRLWVTSNMVKRSIKTDTGFTLKASHEFYDDPARFEMKLNGDGSADYIIKGVRHINET